jgi:hypothetical protein
VVFVVGEIVGFAIDRGRRRVDHAVHVVFARGFNYRLEAVDVVFGDFGWLFDARPDASAEHPGGIAARSGTEAGETTA